MDGQKFCLNSWRARILTLLCCMVWEPWVYCWHFQPGYQCRHYEEYCSHAILFHRALNHTNPLETGIKIEKNKLWRFFFYFISFLNFVTVYKNWFKIDVCSSCMHLLFLYVLQLLHHLSGSV